MKKVYVASWMFNVESDPDYGIFGVFENAEDALALIVDKASKRSFGLMDMGAEVSKCRVDEETGVGTNICLTSTFEGGVDTYHYTVTEQTLTPKSEGKYKYTMEVQEKVQSETVVESDKPLDAEALKTIVEQRRVAGELTFKAVNDVDIWCSAAVPGKEG